MFEVFRLSLSPSAYLKSGRGGNRLRRETQKSLSSCSWGSRGVWQLTNIKWSHYWFSLGLQQTIILVIEYSIDYSIDYRSNQINTFTIKNIYKRKSNIMNELLWIATKIWTKNIFFEILIKPLIKVSLPPSPQHRSLLASCCSLLASSTSVLLFSASFLLFSASVLLFSASVLLFSASILLFSARVLLFSASILLS